MFAIRKRSLRELARQSPSHLFPTIIAAMGYAKSVGKDPGDFVRFFMERQTEWRRLKGDIEAVFQAFVDNFQRHTDMIDDEFKVFVIEGGVILVTAPIEELFAADLERWGLTPDEVREGWAVSSGFISEYTGFRIRYDRFDGKNWIHIQRPQEGGERPSGAGAGPERTGSDT